VTFIHAEKQMSRDVDIDGVRSRMVFVFTTSSLHFFPFADQNFRIRSTKRLRFRDRRPWRRIEQSIEAVAKTPD
jgi:hypothetical protein